MTSQHNDIDVLSVAATTDRLTEIRDFVLQNVSGLGFSDFEQNNVVLAVDEACANLIQHAYRNDPSKSISIRIIVSTWEIRVEISDTSAPFDPSTAELPDMRAYFAEHRHHGLGILLMTRVMDDIQYLPGTGPGAANMLILTKRLTA